MPSAVYELHRLNEKFDLSNAADAQLYIEAPCARPKPHRFGKNPVSHLSQLGKGLEIQEPAEHKGAKLANKSNPFGTLPGDGPALEKHLAFPGLTSKKIMLERAAHRGYQYSLLPLGSQAE